MTQSPSSLIHWNGPPVEQWRLRLCMSLLQLLISNTLPKANWRSWVWCDFCNSLRHTHETCWKIHGKPSNWKNSRAGDRTARVMPTANEAGTSPLSKEQMDQLLKLLKSSSSFGLPSVSVVHTDNKFSALSCCLNSIPWIIDSGTSDHMIKPF